MKLRSLPLVFPLLTLLALCSQATVVNFDSFPLNSPGGIFLPAGYQGLVWSNFGCVNGILNPTESPLITNGFYYGVVSMSNVAVNAGGQPAEIDSATNFNFQSAYFTGGWHSNLNIEVEGFSDTNLIYDQTVVASATTPTLFTFDYLDINRLYFNSYGGQVAFGFDGGAQFAMDNFTFEFIPEPSSLLLTILGTATLSAFVKRKRV
jgi:hypothetical protein